MKKTILMAFLCAMTSGLIAQEPTKKDPPKADITKFTPPKIQKNGKVPPPPPPPAKLKKEIVKFEPPTIVKDNPPPPPAKRKKEKIKFKPPTIVKDKEN